MFIEGLRPVKIQEILGLSSAFISKWKVCYALEGIEGIKLKHQGSKGYLSSGDRQHEQMREKEVKWEESLHLA